MLEGGLSIGDLVTIIGEQTIQIRLLKQDKRDLEAANESLKLQLALNEEPQEGAEHVSHTV